GAVELDDARAEHPGAAGDRREEARALQGLDVAIARGARGAGKADELLGRPGRRRGREDVEQLEHLAEAARALLAFGKSHHAGQIYTASLASHQRARQERRTPGRNDMLDRRTFALGAALAPLAIDAGRGQAGWPDRVIRIIVPFAPGAFTDVSARL